MGRMALLVSNLISYAGLKRNTKPLTPPSKKLCLPFSCLLTHVLYIYINLMVPLSFTANLDR